MESIKDVVERIESKIKNNEKLSDLEQAVRVIRRPIIFRKRGDIDMHSVDIYNTHLNEFIKDFEDKMQDYDYLQDKDGTFWIFQDSIEFVNWFEEKELPIY